jgi:uncharacterized protein
VKELALSFDCEGDRLYGVATVPGRVTGRGVLVIVGGPQYRAGSHRQFVLLARSLAEAGVATMRFDVRGMGDSEGAPRPFDATDRDIRAAVDAFFAAVPELTEVVLWGLCDGASAACLYAHGDERVSGVVLLNPWVREAASEARATLRHYYWQRATDGAFWRKVISGRFNPFRSAASLAQVASRAVAATPAGCLPDRMLQGLLAFRGRILFITSGKDLTAQEFNDVTSESPRWRKLMADKRSSACHLADADHTFARAEWRDAVAQLTARWLD